MPGVLGAAKCLREQSKDARHVRCGGKTHVTALGSGVPGTAQRPRIAPRGSLATIAVESIVSTSARKSGRGSRIAPQASTGGASIHFRACSVCTSIWMSQHCWGRQCFRLVERGTAAFAAKSQGRRQAAQLARAAQWARNLCCMYPVVLKCCGSAGTCTAAQALRQRMAAAGFRSSKGLEGSDFKLQFSICRPGSLTEKWLAACDDLWPVARGSCPPTLR